MPGSPRGRDPDDARLVTTPRRICAWFGREAVSYVARRRQPQMDLLHHDHAVATGMSGSCVLIVDDDGSIRRDLELELRYLEATGCG